MLGDAEGEAHVRQFLVRRLAPGDDAQVHVVDNRIVAALHQQAAGDSLEGKPPGARVRQAAGEQQTQVLLGCDQRDRLFIGVRRDDHFGEDLHDLGCSSRIELAVQCDNAAKCGDRIAGECALISLCERGAFGHATGIGVFDDGDRRRACGIEFAHALKGGVGVVDIVVGELLALHLACGGDAGALFGREVKTRRLVRVFAIAHLFCQTSADGAIVGRVLAELGGEPVGNRRIIGGGARIGLLRQRAAQADRRLAGILLQRMEHALVILDIDHHGDVAMVLCRRADHRRAANVDVLDAIVIGCPLRDGGLERVEIDHQEVDGGNRMGEHGRLMFGVFADGEQPAMDRRVQRLHAPVHHFREAGKIGHILHRQAGIGQRFTGSARRDQLNIERMKRAGEIDEA